MMTFNQNLGWSHILERVVKEYAFADDFLSSAQDGNDERNDALSQVLLSTPNNLFSLFRSGIPSREILRRIRVAAEIRSGRNRSDPQSFWSFSGWKLVGDTREKVAQCGYLSLPLDAWPSSFNREYGVHFQVRVSSFAPNPHIGNARRHRNTLLRILSSNGTEFRIWLEPGFLKVRVHELTSVPSTQPTQTTASGMTSNSGFSGFGLNAFKGALSAATGAVAAFQGKHNLGLSQGKHDDAEAAFVNPMANMSKNSGHASRRSSGHQGIASRPMQGIIDSISPTDPSDPDVYSIPVPTIQEGHWSSIYIHHTMRRGLLSGNVSEFNLLIDGQSCGVHSIPFPKGLMSTVHPVTRENTNQLTLFHLGEGLRGEMGPIVFFGENVGMLSPKAQGELCEWSSFESATPFPTSLSFVSEPMSGTSTTSGHQPQLTRPWAVFHPMSHCLARCRSKRKRTVSSEKADNQRSFESHITSADDIKFGGLSEHQISHVNAHANTRTIGLKSDSHYSNYFPSTMGEEVSLYSDNLVFPFYLTSLRDVLVSMGGVSLLLPLLPPPEFELCDTYLPFSEPAAQKYHPHAPNDSELGPSPLFESQDSSSLDANVQIDRLSHTFLAFQSRSKAKKITTNHNSSDDPYRFSRTLLEQKSNVDMMSVGTLFLETVSALLVGHHMISFEAWRLDFPSLLRVRLAPLLCAKDTETNLLRRRAAESIARRSPSPDALTNLSSEKNNAFSREIGTLGLRLSASSFVTDFIQDKIVPTACDPLLVPALLRLFHSSAYSDLKNQTYVSLLFWLPLYSFAHPVLVQEPLLKALLQLVVSKPSFFKQMMGVDAFTTSLASWFRLLCTGTTTTVFSLEMVRELLAGNFAWCCLEESTPGSCDRPKSYNNATVSCATVSSSLDTSRYNPKDRPGANDKRNTHAGNIGTSSESSKRSSLSNSMLKDATGGSPIYMSASASKDLNSDLSGPIEGGQDAESIGDATTKFVPLPPPPPPIRYRLLRLAISVIVAAFNPCLLGGGFNPAHGAITPAADLHPLSSALPHQHGTIQSSPRTPHNDEPDIHLSSVRMAQYAPGKDATPAHFATKSAEVLYTPSLRSYDSSQRPSGDDGTSVHAKNSPHSKFSNSPISSRVLGGAAIETQFILHSIDSADIIPLLQVVLDVYKPTHLRSSQPKSSQTPLSALRNKNINAINASAIVVMVTTSFWNSVINPIVTANPNSKDAAVNGSNSTIQQLPRELRSEDAVANSQCAPLRLNSPQGNISISLTENSASGVGQVHQPTLKHTTPSAREHTTQGVAGPPNKRTAASLDLLWSHSPSRDVLRAELLGVLCALLDYDASTIPIGDSSEHTFFTIWDTLFPTARDGNARGGNVVGLNPEYDERRNHRPHPSHRHSITEMASVATQVGMNSLERRFHPSSFLSLGSHCSYEAIRDAITALLPKASFQSFVLFGILPTSQTDVLASACIRALSLFIRAATLQKQSFLDTLKGVPLTAGKTLIKAATDKDKSLSASIQATAEHSALFSRGERMPFPASMNTQLTWGADTLEDYYSFPRSPSSIAQSFHDGDLPLLDPPASFAGLHSQWPIVTDKTYLEPLLFHSLQLLLPCLERYCCLSAIEMNMQKCPVCSVYELPLPVNESASVYLSSRSKMDSSSRAPTFFNKPGLLTSLLLSSLPSLRDQSSPNASNLPRRGNSYDLLCTSASSTTIPPLLCFTLFQCAFYLDPLVSLVTDYNECERMRQVQTSDETDDAAVHTLNSASSLPPHAQRIIGTIRRIQPFLHPRGTWLEPTVAYSTVDANMDASIGSTQRLLTFVNMLSMIPLKVAESLLLKLQTFLLTGSLSISVLSDCTDGRQVSWSLLRWILSLQSTLLQLEKSRLESATQLGVNSLTEKTEHSTATIQTLRSCILIGKSILTYLYSQELAEKEGGWRSMFRLMAIGLPWSLPDSQYLDELFELLKASDETGFANIFNETSPIFSHDSKNAFSNDVDQEIVYGLILSIVKDTIYRATKSHGKYALSFDNTNWSVLSENLLHLMPLFDRELSTLAMLCPLSPYSNRKEWNSRGSESEKSYESDFHTLLLSLYPNVDKEWVRCIFSIVLKLCQYWHDGVLLQDPNHMTSEMILSTAPIHFPASGNLRILLTSMTLSLVKLLPASHPESIVALGRLQFLILPYLTKIEDLEPQVISSALQSNSCIYRYASAFPNNPSTRSRSGSLPLFSGRSRASTFRSISTATEIHSALNVRENASSMTNNPKTSGWSLVSHPGKQGIPPLVWIIVTIQAVVYRLQCLHIIANNFLHVSTNEMRNHHPFDPRKLPSRAAKEDSTVKDSEHVESPEALLPTLRAEAELLLMTLRTVDNHSRSIISALSEGFDQAARMDTQFSAAATVMSDPFADMSLSSHSSVTKFSSMSDLPTAALSALNESESEVVIYGLLDGQEHMEVVEEISPVGGKISHISETSTSEEASETENPGTKVARNSFSPQAAAASSNPSSLSPREKILSEFQEECEESSGIGQLSGSNSSVHTDNQVEGIPINEVGSLRSFLDAANTLDSHTSVQRKWIQMLCTSHNVDVLNYEFNCHDSQSISFTNSNFINNAESSLESIGLPVVASASEYDNDLADFSDNEIPISTTTGNQIMNQSSNPRGACVINVSVLTELPLWLFPLDSKNLLATNVVYQKAFPICQAYDVSNVESTATILEVLLIMFAAALSGMKPSLTIARPLVEMNVYPKPLELPKDFRKSVVASERLSLSTPNLRKNWSTSHLDAIHQGKSKPLGPSSRDHEDSSPLFPSQSYSSSPHNSALVLPTITLTSLLSESNPQPLTTTSAPATPFSSLEDSEVMSQANPVLLKRKASRYLPVTSSSRFPKVTAPTMGSIGDLESEDSTNHTDFADASNATDNISTVSRASSRGSESKLESSSAFDTTMDPFEKCTNITFFPSPVLENSQMESTKLPSTGELIHIEETTPESSEVDQEEPDEDHLIEYLLAAECENDGLHYIPKNINSSTGKNPSTGKQKVAAAIQGFNKFKDTVSKGLAGLASVTVSKDRDANVVQLALATEGIVRVPNTYFLSRHLLSPELPFISPWNYISTISSGQDMPTLLTRVTYVFESLLAPSEADFAVQFVSNYMRFHLASFVRKYPGSIFPPNFFETASLQIAAKSPIHWKKLITSALSIHTLPLADGGTSSMTVPDVYVQIDIPTWWEDSEGVTSKDFLENMHTYRIQLHRQRVTEEALRRDVVHVTQQLLNRYFKSLTVSCGAFELPGAADATLALSYPTVPPSSLDRSGTIRPLPYDHPSVPLSHMRLSSQIDRFGAHRLLVADVCPVDFTSASYEYLGQRAKCTVSSSPVSSPSQQALEESVTELESIDCDQDRFIDDFGELRKSSSTEENARDVTDSIAMLPPMDSYDVSFVRERSTSDSIHHANNAEGDRSSALHSTIGSSNTDSRTATLSQNSLSMSFRVQSGLSKSALFSSDSIDYGSNASYDPSYELNVTCIMENNEIADQLKPGNRRGSIERVHFTSIGGSKSDAVSTAFDVLASGPVTGPVASFMPSSAMGTTNAPIDQSAVSPIGNDMQIALDNSASGASVESVHSSDEDSNTFTDLSMGDQVQGPNRVESVQNSVLPGETALSVARENGTAETEASQHNEVNLLSSFPSDDGRFSLQHPDNNMSSNVDASNTKSTIVSKSGPLPHQVTWLIDPTDQLIWTMSDCLFITIESIWKGVLTLTSRYLVFEMVEQCTKGGDLRLPPTFFMELSEVAPGIPDGYNDTFMDTSRVCEWYIESEKYELGDGSKIPSHHEKRSSKNRRSLLQRNPLLRKTYRWNLRLLERFYPRRFLSFPLGAEFFFQDGTSAFFSCPRATINDLLGQLMLLKLPTLNLPGITAPYQDTNEYNRLIQSRVHTDPRRLFELSRLTDRWCARAISNYEYLIALNMYAGRSFNDLSQYPVFPWILADWASSTLDVHDPATYRDLTKPIGALNPTRLQQFKERMANMAEFDAPSEKGNMSIHERRLRWLFGVNKKDSASENRSVPAFLYGSHYSSPGVVLYFLLRLEPFSSLAVDLQSGHFDVADRLFTSLPSCWSGMTNNQSDVKEAIPELYSLPDMLINRRKLPLGVSQQGSNASEVQLPPWASTPQEFIQLHRAALESEYVSSMIHHWIDLVFGYKQRGEEAQKADNLFFYLTYEGNVSLQDIADPGHGRALATQILNFGQCPMQLFRKPHRRRIPLKTLLVGQSLPTLKFHFPRNIYWKLYVRLQMRIQERRDSLLSTLPSMDEDDRDDRIHRVSSPTLRALANNGWIDVSTDHPEMPTASPLGVSFFDVAITSFDTHPVLINDRQLTYYKQLLFIISLYLQGRGLLADIILESHPSISDILNQVMALDTPPLTDTSNQKSRSRSGTLSLISSVSKSLPDDTNATAVGGVDLPRFPPHATNGRSRGNSLIDSVQKFGLLPDDESSEQSGKKTHSLTGISHQHGTLHDLSQISSVVDYSDASRNNFRDSESIAGDDQVTVDGDSELTIEVPIVSEQSQMTPSPLHSENVHGIQKMSLQAFTSPLLEATESDTSVEPMQLVSTIDISSIPSTLLPTLENDSSLITPTTDAFKVSNAGITQQASDELVSTNGTRTSNNDNIMQSIAGETSYLPAESTSLHVIGSDAGTEMGNDAEDTRISPIIEDVPETNTESFSPSDSLELLRLQEARSFLFPLIPFQILLYSNIPAASAIVDVTSIVETKKLDGGQQLQGTKVQASDKLERVPEIGSLVVITIAGSPTNSLHNALFASTVLARMAGSTNKKRGANIQSVPLPQLLQSYALYFKDQETISSVPFIATPSTGNVLVEPYELVKNPPVVDNSSGIFLLHTLPSSHVSSINLLSLSHVTGARVHSLSVSESKPLTVALDPRQVLAGSGSNLKCAAQQWIAYESPLHYIASMDGGVLPFKRQLFNSRFGLVKELSPSHKHTASRVSIESETAHSLPCEFSFGKFFSQLSRISPSSLSAIISLPHTSANRTIQNYSSMPGNQSRMALAESQSITVFPPRNLQGSMSRSVNSYDIPRTLETSILFTCGYLDGALRWQVVSSNTNKNRVDTWHPTQSSIVKASPVLCLAVDPVVGDNLVTAHSDGSVTIWRVNHASRAKSSTFSSIADTKTLLAKGMISSSKHGVGLPCPLDTTTVYGTETNINIQRVAVLSPVAPTLESNTSNVSNPIEHMPTDAMVERYSITSVAYSHFLRIVFVGDSTGRVVLRNSLTGEVIRVFNPHVPTVEPFSSVIPTCPGASFSTVTHQSNVDESPSSPSDTAVPGKFSKPHTLSYLKSKLLPEISSYPVKRILPIPSTATFVILTDMTEYVRHLQSVYENHLVSARDSDTARDAQYWTKLAVNSVKNANQCPSLGLHQAKRDDDASAHSIGVATNLNIQGMKNLGGFVPSVDSNASSNNAYNSGLPIPPTAPYSLLTLVNLSGGILAWDFTAPGTFITSMELVDNIEGLSLLTGTQNGYVQVRNVHDLSIGIQTRLHKEVNLSTRVVTPATSEGSSLFSASSVRNLLKSTLSAPAPSTTSMPPKNSKFHGTSIADSAARRTSISDPHGSGGTSNSPTDVTYGQSSKVSGRQLAATLGSTYVNKSVLRPKPTLVVDDSQQNSNLVRTDLSTCSSFSAASPCSPSELSCLHEAGVGFLEFDTAANLTQASVTSLMSSFNGSIIVAGCADERIAYLFDPHTTLATAKLRKPKLF